MYARNNEVNLNTFSLTIPSSSRQLNILEACERTTSVRTFTGDAAIITSKNFPPCTEDSATCIVYCSRPLLQPPQRMHASTPLF